MMTVTERLWFCVLEQSQVSGPTERPSLFERRSTCRYHKLLACVLASTGTLRLHSSPLLCSFTQWGLSEASDAVDLARHHQFPSHLPHALALLSHASRTHTVALAGPTRRCGPEQQAKPGESYSPTL